MAVTSLVAVVAPLTGKIIKILKTFSHVLIISYLVSWFLLATFVTI